MKTPPLLRALLGPLLVAALWLAPGALRHSALAGHGGAAKKRRERDNRRLGGTNVLFVVSDDLNLRLHCYGDPLVQSPTIDALAAAGRKFDFACCQYPLCNPSRSSFLTGLRPETTRVFGNNTALRSQLPKVVTMPQFFRQHGYVVAGFGKVFHIADPDSWDASTQTRAVRKKDHQQVEFAAEGDNVARWGPVDHHDEEELDGQAAREAVKFLEERRAQPFFLAVGFHRPHIPWFAPRPYFDLYPPAKMPLPPLLPGPGDIPEVARGRTAEALGLENAGPDRQRQAIAAYYACITFMDRQLGLVVDELRKQDLLDRTVIVVLGDNGWQMGEHGSWGKMTLFEESVRIPLVIAGPGVERPGEAAAAPVELLDLFPTLTDLCDLPRPPHQEGVTLRPLLDDPAASWDRPARAVMQREGIMGRMVRTPQWHYNEWGSPKQAELYDLNADPLEQHNLARDPSYADEIVRLRRLLK